MKELFKRLLSEKDKELIIILDSLDQLRDSGAGIRQWMPKSLPKSITLILSSVLDGHSEIVDELKVYSFSLISIVFSNKVSKIISIEYKIIFFII